MRDTRTVRMMERGGFARGMDQELSKHAHGDREKQAGRDEQTSSSVEDASESDEEEAGPEQRSQRQWSLHS